MSSIERMSIQGIRSFGPDDKDRGIIKFYAPLTLILGPNGTGKTTIIECLKYMTTGSLPAGGKQASTFIHDPKVANEREVKAQVQLQFRNVAGKAYCIKRSLTATQQVKTVKMATLDSILSWMGPDGRKESITSRCTELDRTMVNHLGVSKAVLENVIFCHQEDSTWPLSEGKFLKEKFDDIFASTRYVKALEVMRNVRKNLDAKVKCVSGVVKYLKQNKDKAHEIRADMEETKVKYDSAKESVGTVKERLEPIEEKLEHLSTKENEIYSLHTAIEKLKSERSQMVKGMQELRDNIENEFTGSVTELEEQLEDFQNKVKEREITLKELEHEQTLLETELNRLSEEKSTLLVELGKLEQEAQHHKDGISSRDRLVKKIANDYNIEGFSGRLDDARVTSFMQDLESTAKDFLLRAREKREEFEEKEGKLQSDIESAHKTQTTLTTEINLKEETIAKNKADVREINQRLSRVDASKDRLVEVNREQKTMSRELEETEKVVDLDALLREIDDLASQRTTLDAKFKRLDTELSRMHAESSARTQLDMLKRDRASREEQIQKLKTRNEDALKHLLHDMPSDKFTRELNNYISSQTREIQKDTKDQQRTQMELSSKRQERLSLQEQLNNKKEELEGYERKIRNECETQDFDEGLEKLGQDLEKKRNDKGLLEGMTHVYNKYISKLNRENPPCPLCERPFSEDSEVDDLIALLERRLQIVPDRVQTVENEIMECQEKYNRLQQLRPYRASIADLKDTDIPNLETRLSNVDEHIVRLRKIVEEKEEELELKQSDEGTAKSLQPDMVLLDKSISEMRELNRKIAAQSAKITSGDSDRTIQQVGAEREDVQEKLEEVRNGHERKQKKAMDHQKRVQQLRAVVNDLQAEKLTIERDLQDQKQLEQSKSELLTTSETLSAEVQEAKDQLKPLKERIVRITGERDRIATKKEETYDKDKEQFDRMRAAGKEVRDTQKWIDRYVQDGRAEALADRTRQQHQLEKKAGEIDINRERLRDKIQKIRKDLDTQRMQEREMQDNLLLLRRQEEIEAKGRIIERQEEKLGGLDVSRLEREKQKLRSQQEDLMKEKHQSEGRKQALEDELRRFMKELQSEQYCNAEDDYMDKMITLRTTEIAVSDLDKTMTAYDHGIMNFHKQKMAEINMIIRELWRNTYRGNDIETIEIRSDEDGVSMGTTKRRNYNYRVVMIKRDVALDMRGRCSAGQKVLASLIIRLALAETFCINCGILALDEPTTNLDRENIESLAYALVEIIKSRAQQKNFQLVVITHDEDFVDLLGRSDYVDKFFKVRKNKYACSELVEADVKDLGSR